MFDHIKNIFQKYSPRELSPSEQALRNLGIKYKRRNDGTLFVSGNIVLSNKNLTTLPDLSDVHVGGDFRCDNNRLTSLAGAPQTVGGDFWCDNNQLTSLVGAPATVGGDFWCDSNQLTGLAGAPQTVGGDFWCQDNQLASLAGAPQTVGEDFYCGDNQLTGLAGAPQTVGGDFWCNNNQLTNLEYAPQVFAKMISDFGEFEKWDDVPEEFRISPGMRERMAREQERMAQAVHDAFNQKVHRATVTQKPVRLLPKIKVPR